MFCIFFFFKQKTAYEMRISDWSSDVCSSDLSPVRSRRCTHLIADDSLRRTRDPPSAETLLSSTARRLKWPRFMRALATLSKSATASRSEEHTSELQSLMRKSYAVFCLKKKSRKTVNIQYTQKKQESTLTISSR